MSESSSVHLTFKSIMKSFLTEASMKNIHEKFQRRDNLIQIRPI